MAKEEQFNWVKEHRRVSKRNKENQEKKAIKLRDHRRKAVADGLRSQIKDLKEQIQIHKNADSIRINEYKEKRKEVKKKRLKRQYEVLKHPSTKGCSHRFTSLAYRCRHLYDNHTQQFVDNFKSKTVEKVFIKGDVPGLKENRKGGIKDNGNGEFFMTIGNKKYESWAQDGMWDFVAGFTDWEYEELGNVRMHIIFQGLQHQLTVQRMGDKAHTVTESLQRAIKYVYKKDMFLPELTVREDRNKKLTRGVWIIMENENEI